MNTDYELSFDRSRIDRSLVHAFLTTSYWSPGIRRDVVGRAIDHSLVLGVYEPTTGAQVAFARVVTDYASFAWVCDVFVLDEHRGRGLGKRMMAALLAHPELATLRRWSLGTKDAHGLYAQFGFAPADATRMMEMKPDPSAWREKA